MSKSILVIGAGITGVSSAEWLRRDGWDVTLIDRIDPGHQDQASFGNAGLIARGAIIPVSTPSLLTKAPAMLLNPNSPLYLRWSYLPRLMPWLVPFLRNATVQKVTEVAAGLAMLTSDSVDQHQALSAGTPAATFIQTGDYVNLFINKAAYDADQLSSSLRKEHGFDPDHIGRNEILDRDPNIGPTYTFGTVYKDYGWLSSPGDYVAALFGHFLSQGGQFKRGEVADIVAGDTPSVTLKGGEAISADKIVLSAGAWSQLLTKKLAPNVKLEAERGYHVSMYNPNFTALNPYFIVPDRGYVKPTALAGWACGTGHVDWSYGIIQTRQPHSLGL